MQGRWDSRHLEHITAMDCDVLLLTEVSDRVELPGYRRHATQLLMSPRRRWAAVASRAELSPLDDPHGASAMAEVGGIRFCSSILPWRQCGTREPWNGRTTAEKTTAAVDRIEPAAPNVWGGDWNHALTGREWTGTVSGRRHLLDATDRLGLTVPTAASPHQIDGLLSIDHIAVPKSWSALGVEGHPASTEGGQISDHDAYVVEVLS